jgi:hypothetical protein
MGPSDKEWDVARHQLRRIEAMAHAQVGTTFRDYGIWDAGGWSTLKIAETSSIHMAFAVGINGLYIPREICSGVQTAVHDNGLSVTLAFDLGELAMTVEGSDWQQQD